MACTETQPRILVVVAGGGYSNAAPILEIASLLAARGYRVEFATLQGRDKWCSNWPCVSRSHIIGGPVPPEIEEANYLRMSTWSEALERNWTPVFESRKFLESSWPDVYYGLKRLAENQDTKPDFILADYLVDAARDVSFEYDIPLAMHWPQMPTAMLPSPYIPGTPGLQIEVLTSEFATLWQRVRSALAIYTSLPHYLNYLSWQRRMRASMGVHRRLEALRKPNYLCLVNSFFALEAAKDLPPNVAAIGPILPDKLPSVDSYFRSFLSPRSNVLYISLGTHVLLSHDTLGALISGAMSALQAGLIDGIIWSIRSLARAQLDLQEEITWDISGTSDEAPTPDRQKASFASILNNEIPSLLVTDFAPQRGLLADRRIIAFVSHCGASSTNEAVFAGVPIIALPVYFDQIQYAMRVRDAGVAIVLRKNTFQPPDVTSAIKTIAADRVSEGAISINSRRVASIARIAARRKSLGADLIEEVLEDWRGRRRERDTCLNTKGSRAMHLETADMRMPIWRARNWDLYALGASVCLAAMGSLAMMVSLVMCV